MEIWKEFEQNEITHSIAHHLMAVDDLTSKQGYARVTDVARYLNITKGSASITLKHLKERGYLKEDENKFFHLSERGLHIAHLVLSKRKIIIKFLTDVLQVASEQAEIDACKIEHLISIESGENLLHFLQYICSDEPKARDFLTTFRHHQIACHDSGTCNICEDVCLFDEMMELEDNN